MKTILRNKIESLAQNERIKEIKETIRVTNGIKRQEIKDLNDHYAFLIREELDLPITMKVRVGAGGLNLHDGLFKIEKEPFPRDGESPAYTVQINFPGLGSRIVFRDEYVLDEETKTRNERINDVYQYYAYFTTIMNDAVKIGRVKQYIDELAARADEIYATGSNEELYQEERDIIKTMAEELVEEIAIGDNLGKNNTVIYNGKFSYDSELIVDKITAGNIAVRGDKDGFEVVRRIKKGEIVNAVRSEIRKQINDIYKTY